MLIEEFKTNTELQDTVTTPIHFAQQFLNRLMFIFFAEDTNKLPERLFEKRIINILSSVPLSEHSHYVCDSISDLFESMNKGSETPIKIFGFNGGLFYGKIPLRIYFKDLRSGEFFKQAYKNSNLLKITKLDKNTEDVLELHKGKLNLIIRNMLLMASFDFKTEVNVNILGHIFEQSISDIEQLKEGKDDKRKKDGIFYTPEYITNYICRNTIIPYLSKSRTNDIKELISEYSDDISVLEDKFQNIKILDPACGSGAFLIKATDVLLEIFKEIQNFKQIKGIYHKEMLASAKNNKKLKKFVGRQLNSLENSGESLNWLKKNWEEQEARMIIKNNIYGVDINEESVEITQLSLFLKMATKNKKLINLSDNIKCGNSLIDDSEVDKEKAFKWKEKFKDIFEKNGGFDVIIGNPPYGAELTKEEQEWLNKKYSLGSTDTAQLMMLLSQSLLKNTGINGFIIPKAFIFASNWKNIRNRFLPNIKTLVDCKKVWNEVKLEQVIYCYHKYEKFESYETCSRQNEIIISKGKIDKKYCHLFDFILNDITNNELEIGLKIKKVPTNLGDVSSNKRGMIVKNYNLLKNNKGMEDKKLLCGANIQQYYIFGKKGYIHESEITTNSIITENSILVQGIVAHIQKPFDHIKLIGSILDKKKNMAIMDNINQIRLENKINNKYAISLLNSKLISWYSYRFIYARAIRTMRFDTPITSRIPFPVLDKNKQKPFIEKSSIMLDLNKQFYDKKQKFLTRLKDNLGLENATKKLENFYEMTFSEFIKELKKQKINISYKEQETLDDYFIERRKELLELKEKIDKTGKKIDKMVYALYGLTDDEIKIIESNVNPSQ